MLKIDDNGAVVYTRTFGGTDNDEAFSVIEKSNNITMAGSTLSADLDVTENHGSLDAWIVNYDGGSVTWKKNFGGIRFDQTPL